jgi:hypothetical protein
MQCNLTAGVDTTLYNNQIYNSVVFSWLQHSVLLDETSDVLEEYVSPSFRIVWGRWKPEG